MKWILIIILALLLAGCAGTRHASTTRIDRDSTYASVWQLDSLYRAIWQHDSVYTRDSICIYEKGDTVTKYVEKTMYKWCTSTDTVYRDRWRADTVYIGHTDSVTVERPVYIEKPIKWYNRVFIWGGKAGCIILLFGLAFLYLKRKF